MNHEPGPLTRFAQFIETFWQQSQQERKPLLKSILRWLTPNGGTILIALLLVLTQSVWANNLSSTTNAGPSATTINYQGRLADSSGNPITQNDVAITFTIYDAADAGNALWTEQHVVNVANGLFNVGLGDLTQNGIPTNIWNGDRYLEITVGSETLSPRELIRSVPLAGMALTVPDGTITKEKLGTGVNNFFITSGILGVDINTPGWTLHNGTGVRTYVANVSFGQTFSAPPVVVASISKIDILNTSNSVLTVYTQNVTTTGFELVCLTYGSSSVYGTNVSWIAYGQK